MKVLKFGAVWCSGCLVIRPRWQKIEKDHPWLKTEYYDFDNDKLVVKKYDIEAGRLPTFIFLDKNSREITRISGELSVKELEKHIFANKNK